MQLIRLQFFMTERYANSIGIQLVCIFYLKLNIDKESLCVCVVFVLFKFYRFFSFVVSKHPKLGQTDSVREEKKRLTQIVY